MILIRRPWTRQPPEGVPVNFGHPLADGLEFCVSGGLGQSKSKFVRPGFVGTGASLTNSPLGSGYAFDGSSTAVVRYTADVLFAAGDEFSLELVLSGSAFPSLASLASWAYGLYTTGAIGTGGLSDDGRIRGLIAYTGTAPCNIYGWFASRDFNSGVAWGTNAMQHVVLTKSAASSSPTIAIYRNGALLASGSAGAGTFGESGPYLYIGGRHATGSASATATVMLVRSYRRTLNAQRVQALAANPWQIFSPRSSVIPATAAASGLPTLTGITLSNITTSGYRATVAGS